MLRARLPQGELNTATSAHAHAGYLRKSFYTHTPISMQRVLEAAAAQRSGARPSDPSVDPDRLFPAGFKSLLLKVGGAVVACMVWGRIRHPRLGG